MRKINLIIMAVLFCGTISAQVQHMLLHSNGNIMYQSAISDIDSVKFTNTATLLHTNNNYTSFTTANLDSITFSDSASISQGTIVYITYNDNQVSVINPYENQGLTITFDSTNVNVVSAANLQDIEYVVAGTSSNGFLKFNSDKRFTLTLNNLNLTNPAGAAIDIVSDKKVTVQLVGNNTLSDGSSGTAKATLLSESQLIFNGEGSLNVSGLKKHAINSSDYVEIDGGSINILSAASDGIHCEYFIINDGLLTTNTTGDGIDAGLYVEINGGTINSRSSSQDMKAIKSDSLITVNGGIITLTISGDQSKGISSKGDVVFNGGVASIEVSGSTVLEASGSGYDPSYCTGIKADGNITINNGNIQITATSSNLGGKGLSADGNVLIYNGIVNISTAGNGTTYTNESGTTDSYTSCCIKSDAHISILKGTITCNSSGTGGKGISADSTLIIGIANESNDSLLLTVNTSGERFYVSGQTGGMGGDDSADYANPKAIKSIGNLTVNSGTLSITCSQQTEGGEGLESKDTLTLNGGMLEISTYDDCINSANHFVINGGTHYCYSRGNDAIDCNGTITITGGLTIACGTRAPEEGFDCDMNTFKITGGIIIGTGGATSNPSNVSTQKSIIYNSSSIAGQNLCIKNSSGTAILIYKLPTFSTSGRGGNQMTLLFSSPDLTNGNYTLYYGGSISLGNGSNFHGYYSNGATHSGGTSKSFSVSNYLTTIH